MKTKKGLLLLLALPALLGCSDKKVDELFDKLFPPAPPVALPAITQVGANTFGCLIDGKVWEAKNGPTSFIGNNNSPNAHYFQRELRLYAFWRLESGGSITSFDLTLPRVVGPGVYSLGGPGVPLGLARLGPLPYVTDATNVGSVTITRLDTVGSKAFVAGTFELCARPSSNTGGNGAPSA